MGYTLEDAQEMHERYPETFEIPSELEILKLQVGDNVKLCFNNEERMWVEIIQIESKDCIIGALNNDPVRIDGIRYGSIIEFSHRNIYSILH